MTGEVLTPICSASLEMFSLLPGGMAEEKMAFSSSSYTMSEILAKGFFSWAAVIFCAVNRQPSRCLGSWGIGHLASEKYLYPIIAAAGAKIKPAAENRAGRREEGFVSPGGSPD